MSVILIILLLIIVINLIGRYLYRKFILQFQNKYKDQQGQQRHKDGDVYIKNKPKEKKYIPKDEGEYVDFEEVDEE